MQNMFSHSGCFEHRALFADMSCSFADVSCFFVDVQGSIVDTPHRQRDLYIIKRCAACETRRCWMYNMLLHSKCISCRGLFADNASSFAIMSGSFADVQDSFADTPQKRPIIIKRCAACETRRCWMHNIFSTLPRLPLS